MPQTSNKISSFIGFILLILIIAFTVFINFDSREEIKEKIVEIPHQKINKEEIPVKSYFNGFTQEDIENFWKLENFKTDSIKVDNNKNTISMQIEKLLLITKTKTYNHVKDETTFNKLNDSLEIVFQKKYGGNYKKGGFWTSHPDIPSITTHLLKYGTLVFNFIYQKDYNKVFNSFEVENQSFRPNELEELGNIFIKYQIRKVYTDPEEIGDFTVIVLEDGKNIFLIKENAIVRRGRYFDKLLTRASYINDSTRIIYPSNY